MRTCNLATIPALCIVRMSSAIDLVSFVSKDSRCSRLQNVPHDFKLDAGAERRRATHRSAKSRNLALTCLPALSAFNVSAERTCSRHRVRCEWHWGEPDQILSFGAGV